MIVKSGVYKQIGIDKEHFMDTRERFKTYTNDLDIVECGVICNRHEKCNGFRQGCDSCNCVLYYASANKTSFILLMHLYN